jgi:hypothetical protein
MLAGSILFLEPGERYQIWLSLSDPEGGRFDTSFSISTRSVPAIPLAGKEYHVVPGSGGGTGSEQDPFKGLAAAQSAANPSDIIFIHAGNYGNFIFTKPGAEKSYMVWKAAGDGDPVFDYGRVSASYVWLEGLKFVKATDEDRGLVGDNSCEGVVVTRCDFKGFNYGINLKEGCADWYIADNTIVGDKDNPKISDFGGEGVELNHTSGHTVAYNSISNVADGVSYAHRNCDIFGNDIFNTSDDGIEPDYGYANIRMWCNRISNPCNNAFSFQPMYCGPWYIIRNQVAAPAAQMLKYRVQDRFLLAHNTFVGWYTIQTYAHHILSAMSRNNLWIQLGGSGYVWEGDICDDTLYCLQPNRFTADWRTDVDYDGFAYEGAANVFKWNDPVERYPDLAGVVADAGIETHGVRVVASEIFDTLRAPKDTSEFFERQYFTLKKGCAAEDAGDVIPNINDGYSGDAPDLGAYEIDMPLPHYGPRPEGTIPVALPGPKNLSDESMPWTIRPLNNAMFILEIIARTQCRVDVSLFGPRGDIYGMPQQYEMASGRHAQSVDFAGNSHEKTAAGMYICKITVSGRSATVPILVR